MMSGKRSYRMASRRHSRSVTQYTTADKSGLSEDQLKEIIASFEMIDVNGDGRISKTELTKAAALVDESLTKRHIEHMMKSADLDGDGFINFQEYKQLMKGRYITVDMEKERILTTFRALDQDGDGFITRKELSVALGSYNDSSTHKDLQLLLDEADTNGDGKIDYEEFVEAKLHAKLYG